MKEEQEAAMITILTGVAALVVGALIGAVLGFQYRRRVAEAEVDRPSRKPNALYRKP